MANRSRLGRDPLQAAPKPSASKPAAPRRKPAAAKGGASADATSPTSPLPQVLETAPPAQPAAVAPDRSPEPAPEADQASLLSGTPSPDQPPADADRQTAAPAQTHEAATSVQADSAPAADAAASGEARPAACPGPAGPALSTDAHPVAVFLRGVLEGLLPDGEAALCVDVDESTSALPVEKLFFFSHALQRIAMPLENAASAGWRPGTATGPLPVLTARLRPIGQGRHSLTLFDNGCFFQSRLPGLSLGMEALTPLTTFVAKRHGSVVLAQGHVTAFEIIG